MKILVTGGKGYIGSSLVSQLKADGHKVEVYDKPNDIRDSELLQEAVHGKDAVVHLVATFDSDPTESMNINYLAATWVAFVANQENIKRFIFTSTCGVLNKEDKSPYTKWKRSAEPTMRHYGYTVLRLASVYGLSPVMSYEPLVNRMVKDARENEEISVFGATEYRPLVHIEDVVRAIGILLGVKQEKIAGQDFNLATENRTKRWLAREIGRTWDSVKIREQVNQSEGYTVGLSSQLIKLGFTPSKFVIEGIQEMTC